MAISGHLIPTSIPIPKHTRGSRGPLYTVSSTTVKGLLVLNTRSPCADVSIISVGHVAFRLGATWATDCV
jgi:hypothetical protein